MKMTELLIQKHMLTRENIAGFLPQNTNRILESKKVEKKEKNVIQNADVLFWTIYKIVNGDFLYETSNNFKTEKDFKIKSIEELRKYKSDLKTHKLRLTEIEDQLLNHKKINLEAFFGLALLYKLNIFYIWDHKFYEFTCNSDEKLHVIKNVNNTITILNENTHYYKDNYYAVENLTKPIRSMTAYSKDELIILAKKLNIDIGNEKIVKREIYEKILTKI